jgi:putative copper resistance protein D
MTEAWIATRFVHFATAMAVFGIVAFRLYAFAGHTTPPGAPTRAALDASLAKLSTAGAVVALLSALAIVPFIAAEMAGSDAASLDPAIWHAVLVGTEFGRVWCWHLGFAGALLALCLLPIGRWQVGASTVAALLLLVSLGWIGHAAMDMGGGITHEINQSVHLAAAGIWLGGLVPLGVLLQRAVRPGGANYVPLASFALPHFSQMGYAAVALIAITGTVNSIMLVGSFDALVMTPYGRLLCLKITLVVAMVALALINRFRLVPRLRNAATAPASLRALLRSVAVEQALGVAILAVVAVLGTWPPAVEATMNM